MNLDKKKKKESFLSHLEDLRWHLTRSVICVVMGTLIAFLNKEFLFDKIIFACKENSFPTYVFYVVFQINYV